MPRYFLEVAYKGTHYKGFQVQKNAVTIQSEVEKALAVVFRKEIMLSGSSRTDAGVHALQNFFHFDFEEIIEKCRLYNINAILPPDIAVKQIFPVKDDAHCRFNATSREYKYVIYQHKDPFLEDRGWYYPYSIDIDLLQQAAMVIMQYKDFTSFSKRNTQVKSFVCNIITSEWCRENDCIIYKVSANRFLRGMVRGLVGTMLHVGRKQISVNEFKSIIESKDCTKADFTTPAHGLFLVKVNGLI